MTKFEKSQFNYHGGYLTYGPDRKFVARFKHVAGNRAGFTKFLIKHFTVEEYFAAREANVNDGSNAPACILEAKGYVSAHILKWLKEGKLQEWKGFGYDHWKALN